MQGKEIEVIGVGGDSHLGGEDFDNAMLDYCIEEFKKKEGVDLKEGKNSSVVKEKMNANRRLRRLKNECEKQKIHLSALKSVHVSLAAMYNEKNMHVRIFRETFESINKDSFDKCIKKTMEKVIKDAKLTKESIHDVILIGGSSKIPSIQARITNYFGKKSLQNIKGDEAVAHGAALHASMLSGKNKGGGLETAPFIIRDVCPHAVGIKVYVHGSEENNFSSIIKQNSKVPCKKTERYLTRDENQKAVLIEIYEGEITSVKDNTFLGSFVVNNLPENCPKGEPIDVTMEFSPEGILHCTANCPRNAATSKLVLVVETKGRLTSEEIQKMRIQEINE